MSGGLHGKYMTDQELKAYGIDLPDAEGILDTPEKLRDFYKRLEESCREDFKAFDKAKKESWAASFTRIFG